MTEDTSTASDPNVTGVLDINEKGFGFLRKAKNNYLAGDDDVFVAPDMIRQNKLVAGLTLEGPAKWTDNAKARSRSAQLRDLISVNGEPPSVFAACKPFTELTSTDPTEILTLESPSNNHQQQTD